MPPLALSSWSLHASLGRPVWRLDADGRLVGGPQDPATLRLEDLPRVMAERGLRVLELVHFHLDDLTPTGLARLRAAIEAAGVRLATLLIDEGDLAHPDPMRRRDELARLEAWIDRAALLGAEAVRIVAGEQAADDAVIERSVAGLRHLAAQAARQGLATRTENFRRTGDDLATLLAILDACDGAVSCTVDLGNAERWGEGKVAGIAALAPQASAVHAKARYRDGVADAEELQRCLEPFAALGYTGHISLIHGEHPDEWQDLAELGRICSEAFAG